MKQLKFECPECGTEFTLTANQTKAKERIEALKKPVLMLVSFLQCKVQMVWSL